METLTFSHRPLLPSRRLSTYSGYAPTSFSLFRSSPSRVGSLRCSATSSPSLVDHSAKFREAARHGNLIPLYRSIFSDHLTPVLAYRCLVKEDERDAPSFLFESVEPGLQVSSVVSTTVPPPVCLLREMWEGCIVEINLAHKIPFVC